MPLAYAMDWGTSIMPMVSPATMSENTRSPVYLQRMIHQPRAARPYFGSQSTMGMRGKCLRAARHVSHTLIIKC